MHRVRKIIIIITHLVERQVILEEMVIRCLFLLEAQADWEDEHILHSIKICLLLQNLQITTIQKEVDF